MAYNNINIPATLVHKVHGVQYKLNGTIIAINESNDTCTMRFKTGVESGIPMDKLYINEGFIDTLKNLKQSFRNWIAKKVKGFYVLVDKTGNVIQNSINSIFNIAKAYNDGKLPDGVKVCYSDNVAQKMGLPKSSIEDTFYDAEEKEIADANAYFGRIMKRFGSTDDTLEESVKYVQNRYYHSLNEAAPVLSIPDPEDSVVGRPVNNAQLRSTIINSFSNQLSKTAASRPAIPFIWGAPGIGKTSIIKQSITEFKKLYDGVNLNLVTVNLANKTGEDFSLPGKASVNNIPEVMKSSSMGQRATLFPVYWMPVYQADDITKDYWDDFMNTGQWLGQTRDKYNNSYEGGIIFFDEYTRVGTSQVYSTLMALIFDRVFADNWHVASQWGFICAANRSIDDDKELDDEFYNFMNAQKNRFNFYTYEPSKEDWLKWAKQMNSSHKLNINPYIITFIETHDDGDWYSTVKDYSYESLSDNTEDLSKIKTRDGLISVVNQKMRVSPLMYTPRTWQQITEAYRNALETLFGVEVYQEMIDKSVTKTKSNNGRTVTDYLGEVPEPILKEYLSKIDDYTFERWYTTRFESNLETNPELKIYRDDNGKISLSNKVQILNHILEFIIADNINDPGYSNRPNTPPLSKVMKDWKDYMLYKKIYTLDAYKNIGDEGCLPVKFDAKGHKDYTEKNEDDLYFSSLPDYIKANTAKWKIHRSIIKVVSDEISNFKYTIPDLDQLVSKDIDEFIKYRNNFEKKYHTNNLDEEPYNEFMSRNKAAIDKLNDHFTIRVKTEKGNEKAIPLLKMVIDYIYETEELFLDDRVSTNKISLDERKATVVALYRTLINFTSAYKLCNVVLYLCKLRYQTNQTQATVGIQQLLEDKNGFTTRLSGSVKARYNDAATGITNLNNIVKAKQAKENQRVKQNNELKLGFDAPAIYMLGYYTQMSSEINSI